MVCGDVVLRCYVVRKYLMKMMCWMGWVVRCASLNFVVGKCWALNLNAAVNAVCVCACVRVCVCVFYLIHLFIYLCVGGGVDPDVKVPSACPGQYTN